MMEKVMKDAYIPNAFYKFGCVFFKFNTDPLQSSDVTTMYESTRVARTLRKRPYV